MIIKSKKEGKDKNMNVIIDKFNNLKKPAKIGVTAGAACIILGVGGLGYNYLGENHGLKGRKVEAIPQYILGENKDQNTEQKVEELPTVVGKDGVYSFGDDFFNYRLDRLKQENGEIHFEVIMKAKDDLGGKVVSEPSFVILDTREATVKSVVGTSDRSGDWNPDAIKKGDEINIKVSAKIDKANLIHIQGSNGKVSMIKLEG